MAQWSSSFPRAFGSPQAYTPHPPTVISFAPAELTDSPLVSTGPSPRSMVSEEADGSIDFSAWHPRAGPSDVTSRPGLTSEQTRTNSFVPTRVSSPQSRLGFAPSMGSAVSNNGGAFIPPINFFENVENPTSTDRITSNLCHRFRPYRYYSSRQKWKHLQMLTDDLIHDMIVNPTRRYPSHLKIITWNIDFVTPQPEARLLAALRYIQRTLGCERDTDMPEEAICILLQEVHRDVFQSILDDEWVRNCWVVAPTSPDAWPEDAFYGSVTLVSKGLALVKSQILHYANTNMQRAALAVYVLLSEPKPSEGVAMICVVNTELESLPAGIQYRPDQIKLAADFLKQEDVRGGVVAGDMNAIMLEDARLSANVQLKDAWRRGDQDEEGFTWGYQETFEPGRYPPGRLDKVLYLSRRGYTVDEPRRFGAGVKTSSGHWVSDHYGLETTLRLR